MSKRGTVHDGEGRQKKVPGSSSASSSQPANKQIETISRGEDNARSLFTTWKHRLLQEVEDLRKQAKDAQEWDESLLKNQLELDLLARCLNDAQQLLQSIDDQNTKMANDQMDDFESLKKVWRSSHEIQMTQEVFETAEQIDRDLTKLQTLFQGEYKKFVKLSVTSPNSPCRVSESQNTLSSLFKHLDGYQDELSKHEKICFQ